jgi:hypothetical protein
MMQTDEDRAAFREKIKSISFGKVPGGSKPPIVPDPGHEFRTKSDYRNDKRDQRAAAVDRLIAETPKEWLEAELGGVQSTDVTEV